MNWDAEGEREREKDFVQLSKSLTHTKKKTFNPRLVFPKVRGKKGEKIKNPSIYYEMKCAENFASNG